MKISFPALLIISVIISLSYSVFVITDTVIGLPNYKGLENISNKVTIVHGASGLENDAYSA